MKNAKTNRKSQPETEKVMKKASGCGKKQKNFFMEVTEKNSGKAGK